MREASSSPSSDEAMTRAAREGRFVNTSYPSHEAPEAGYYIKKKVRGFLFFFSISSIQVRTPWPMVTVAGPV